MLLNKTFFTIAAFTSILLIACSGDDEIKTNVAAPATAGTSLLPSTETPATVIDTATLQKNYAGAALNPQHGQPGHRCDIAVGAPLNSPQSNASSSVVIPPTTTATAPVVKTNTAEVKLNPKHGEPGHRCDLAVGAPLDGTK